MQKNILLFIFFSAFSISFGQVGGQSVYQFLNLVTSPRQAALGGKVISIYDEDVNQAQFNPANINEEMDNRFSVNYGNYFNEVTYGTAAYAYTFDRRTQTFFAGANFVNYGKFDGYNEFAQPTGTFSGNEAALSVGYSYNIPFTNMHVGATGKLISSSLETYRSFGGAVDLGFLYVDDKNDVNWAFVIRNFGTQFSTYSGKREKLPTEIMIGISQEVKNIPVRWHVTLENLQQWKIAFANPNRATNTIEGDSEPEKVSILNNVMRHVIVGVEIFPKKVVNLRLGYNFRRGEELSVIDQRNFSGISVGFGLRVNNIKFNYSYSRYTLAANTSLFGLNIDLNSD